MSLVRPIMPKWKWTKGDALAAYRDTSLASKMLREVWWLIDNDPEIVRKAQDLIVHLEALETAAKDVLLKGATRG